MQCAEQRPNPSGLHIMAMRLSNAEGNGVHTANHKTVRTQSFVWGLNYERVSFQRHALRHQSAGSQWCACMAKTRALAWTNKEVLAGLCLTAFAFGAPTRRYVLMKVLFHPGVLEPV